eukprot:TRINITY_DN20780_c0_g1_i1.p1 TRINITY_DN20780_c0_g1~~TRINITY_DN20780_c0_g1_i1.p1  ORF type:complete len:434 (-),score=65.50 TRINITY_DN20780_c0_g1_i1:268-1569(-)
MELSCRHWELIVLVCAVYVTWGLTDSIQAPFYPIEADNKGANAAEYGAVFGIIHLAMFLAGPLFGRYMPRIGVFNVFVFGILGTAVCGCLFGLLTYVNDTWLFLGASYLLRILEGVAEAGAWASVLTILSIQYKEHVTYVYSLTQAAFGFAEILGPSIGGIMFEYGGFILPFEFSGTLCLVVGLLIIFRLPQLLDSSLDDHESKPSESQQFTKLLKNPGVLIALAGTIFGAVCQSFIETFLEEYLAIFGLSVTQIGVSFLAMSVPYMIATPIWGWLVDTCVQPEIISPLGNILIICSLFLIGPVQYLNILPNYELTEIGLGLIGVGTAATLTATFALTQKHALLVLPDLDKDNSSIVSGLWTSAFALGNFLGPTAGGPLEFMFGFQGTTPILQGWAVLMLVLDLVVLCFYQTKNLYARKKSAGSRPELYTRIE